MNSGSSGVALAQKVSCLGGKIVIIFIIFISFYQLISEAGEYNPPGTTPKRLRPFFDSPSRDFA
jgi:hypothetical protein